MKLCILYDYMYAPGFSRNAGCVHQQINNASSTTTTKGGALLNMTPSLKEYAYQC